MSDVAFYYTDDFQAYDMGPMHPLKPSRLRRTYELMRSYGMFDSIEVRTPTFASIEDLRTSHSEEFIWVVDHLSSGEHVPFPQRYGFGQGDNPIFTEMWEASRLYAGASADAARAVIDGARVAGNISGGLHHAHYDRAAGFCVFNDCAVACHVLRRRFDRVAYIDIDVHHGDGVQEAFYDDPSVLTVSIHETPVTLFPGTGHVKEVGMREGTGQSLNVPLWPYSDNETWIDAWRACAMPVLRAFDPQAIVLQMGTDPHYLDPLARLSLTAQGWLVAVRDVISLGRPIVALGGGGYNPTVVPRLWTLAFAELAGITLSDDTPATFANHDQIPTLTDHEMPPIAPHDLDAARAYAQQTIEEVRTLVLPHYGK